MKYETNWLSQKMETIIAGLQTILKLCNYNGSLFRILQHMVKCLWYLCMWKMYMY